MLKKTSFMALAFLCGAIIASPIMADEHIEVGSRADAKEKAASELVRLQLAALESEPAPETSKEKRANARSARGEPDKDSLSLFAYISSHPGAFHNIIDSPTSHSFSLEDGSVWSTCAYVEPILDYDAWGRPFFYYLVTEGFSSSVWYPSDSVVVQPNHWSLGYGYWLTNEATGASIPVNLYLGAYYDSLYKHTIVWIDYDYGYVHLDDGTRWTIDSYGDIRKWLINDTVIIGGKDSWLYSSSPNVLINVNTLNYAAGTSSYY